MANHEPTLIEMSSDPRKRGFGSRSNVNEVVALIVRRVKALGTDTVHLPQAAGRVVSTEAGAEAPAPAFDRAAMDHYSVRAD